MQAMALELKLRELRKKANLSQAELAEAVDVRIATISDLERGESRRIDFDLLESLCDVLTRKLKRPVRPNDLFRRK
jgi:transcriptional regulator with XRE-family HTH domain